MGTLRYILSVAVLISHTGNLIGGYNSGVVAVISFFLISGFVMTILIQRHYSSLQKLKLFYLDRFLRLFPQYLFYLLMVIGLTVSINVQSPFLQNCTPSAYVLNVAMVPLGYYKYLDLEGCLIIPPAWSLGLEATFYLIIPILLYFRRSVPWFVCLSVAVFLLAYIGVLDTDQFGYRLLPGTLFIFLLGASLADPMLLWRYQLGVIWGGGVLLFLFAVKVPNIYSLPYNKEVLLGLIVGVPLVAILRHLPLSSKVDDLLGNLSYGVFLNHFVAIYLIETGLGDMPPLSLSGVLLTIFLSTIFSFVSYRFVEAAAIKARRALRS